MRWRTRWAGNNCRPPPHAPGPGRHVALQHQGDGDRWRGGPTGLPRRRVMVAEAFLGYPQHGGELLGGERARARAAGAYTRPLFSST
jgi:hypothetical protein